MLDAGNFPVQSIATLGSEIVVVMAESYVCDVPVGSSIRAGILRLRPIVGGRDMAFTSGSVLSVYNDGRSHLLDVINSL